MKGQVFSYLDRLKAATLPDFSQVDETVKALEKLPPEVQAQLLGGVYEVAARRFAKVLKAVLHGD